MNMIIQPSIKVGFSVYYKQQMIEVPNLQVFIVKTAKNSHYSTTEYKNTSLNYHHHRHNMMMMLHNKPINLNQWTPIYYHHRRNDTINPSNNQIITTKS